MAQDLTVGIAGLGAIGLHLARALDGFVAPTAPFDPLGAWTATYELVERAFKTVSLGALRLERVPLTVGSSLVERKVMLRRAV